MAATTTVSIMFPNEQGETSMKRFGINYDRKQDNFWVRIPSYLVAGHGWSRHGADPAIPSDAEIRGRTPREVETALEKVCEDYAKACEKQDLVLVYEYDVKDRWGPEYIAIKFKWHKAYRVAVGERACLYEFRDLTGHNVSEQYFKEVHGSRGRRLVDMEDKNIIPWTEDRERFFREFSAAMNKLCDRIELFLSDEDKLIENISAGKLLLEHKETK